MRYASHRRPHRHFPFKLLLLLILAGALVFVMISCSRSDEDVQPPVGDVSPSPTVSSSPTVSPSPTPSDSSAPVENLPTETPGDPVETPPSTPEIVEIPWYLTLVNASHPLPEDFTFETGTLSNGLRFDARAIDALNQMISDCKAAGLQPLVCSAYRTIAKQTELFERKINKYINEGYSYDEAYKIASTIVAIPGTSEHNLGLAVDICTTYYQVLDEGQENTPEQQWLMEHCHEYGFILRYPSDKTELTGIIYEPWHYRYVGVDVATEIMASGICFEEYYELHFNNQ